MQTIYHHFQISDSIENVFKQIATPVGLNKWWTDDASGITELNQTYHLHFGDEYHWMANITKLEPDTLFELSFIKADADWLYSSIGFNLSYDNDLTQVAFYHTGWKTNNEHFKISNYCWAMYLRLLKRYLEFGELVPYKDRLNV